MTSILSEKTHPTLGAAVMGGFIVGSLFIYSESALISKWTFEARGPTWSAGPEPLHATHANRKNRGGSAITTQADGGNFWKRCRFGFFVSTSSRNIGTPYVVKTHLLFPLKPPVTSPHAQLFFVEKLSSLLSPIWPSTSQVRAPNLGRVIGYFSPLKPYRNRENLAFENIISRLVAVLVYWICSYQAIEDFFGLTDFVTVALGIKDVSLYRPHFGPIGEAYSVRQFWG